MESVRFTLNDTPVYVPVERDWTLLWVLRSKFGLTGAKFGCGEGLCGACTVLVDNEAVPSCQLTVADIAGREVKTIEGLGRDGRLHPVQQAFVQHDAMQCGFCTPGMVLKACSLLLANPRPSRTQIIAALDDNLCRCGAHVRIIAAVESAAQMLKGGMPK